MYLAAVVPFRPVTGMPAPKDIPGGMPVIVSSGVMPDNSPTPPPVLYAGYQGGYTEHLPFASNQPTAYAPPAPVQPERIVTREVLKYLPSPLPIFQMPHPSTSSLMTGGEDVGGSTPGYAYDNSDFLRSDDNPALAGLGETASLTPVLLLAGALFFVSRMRF